MEASVNKTICVMVLGLRIDQFGLQSWGINKIGFHRNGRNKDLLQIYYKNYNFRKLKKKYKKPLSLVWRTVAVTIKYSPFLFWPVSQRLVAAIHCKYFVADCSENQELRL